MSDVTRILSAIEQRGPGAVGALLPPETADEAIVELSSLKALFSWLDETSAIYGVWEQLVVTTPVVGKNAHDARFVAVMMVHGLTHLLTFNLQDFRQYSGITAVAPADVLFGG